MQHSLFGSTWRTCVCIGFATGVWITSSACGASDSPTSGSDIPFHGEAPALPGFSYDTGLVPAASPAQVSLAISAGGNIIVDAAGTVSGGKLAGKPGSGRLKLDLHVKLDGRLKIDSALKKHDGDIPGLADINLPIVAETTFDPFLTDARSAVVTAVVPETKLPSIPLGSIPGSLELSTVAGSKLTVSFAEGCVSVSGGKATYSGTATISGTLVMKGAIVLSLPAPLNRTIDLAEIPIPIPEGKRLVSSGAAAVSLPDANEGACSKLPVVEDAGADGSAPTSCDASTCKGCCRDGRCLGGASASACGVGGAACESCSGSTECVRGACEATSCGPDNCSGCCNGDVCVTGGATSACGAGGISCIVCGGGTTCDGKACVDATCKASCASGCCSGTQCSPGTAALACGRGGDACAACPTGKACVAGQCAVAANARFDVMLFSALLPAASLTGDAWDALGGLPDVFAKLTSMEGSSRSEGTSTVLNDTRTPRWNEILLTNRPASELKSSLRIDVFDRDVNFDDTVGGCVIPIADGSFDGALHTATCQASSSGVAFSYTYRLLAR